MPSFPIPEGRRSKRILSKQPRASLVVNLDQKPKIFPCLVLDSTNDGFRVRSNFHLRRSQIVEIILDAAPPDPVRCSVVWVGKTGSRHEGEAGLENVSFSLTTK